MFLFETKIVFLFTSINIALQCTINIFVLYFMFKKYDKLNKYINTIGLHAGTLLRTKYMLKFLFKSINK